MSNAFEGPEPYNNTEEVVDVGTRFNSTPEIRLKYNPRSGGNFKNILAIQSQRFLSHLHLSLIFRLQSRAWKNNTHEKSCYFKGRFRQGPNVHRH